MTPAKRPLSHRSPSPSPSPTLERRSLSPATLPMELEERLAQKRCMVTSSPNVAEVATEEANDHYWPQALNQWDRVCWYVASAGYDIELADSDGLMLAICHWLSGPPPTPRVQPPSVSSIAQPLISSVSLSTIFCSTLLSSPLDHF